MYGSLTARAVADCLEYEGLHSRIGKAKLEEASGILEETDCTFEALGNSRAVLGIRNAMAYLPPKAMAKKAAKPAFGDPDGDPDGDGYITYFEQIWKTDPLAFTSFEDLTHQPGTIYAKMRVSQPFEFADMNGTAYQAARMVNTDDNGTPNNTGDDHFTFEVVLFPYAGFDEGVISTKVDSFPMDPHRYSPSVQRYLGSVGTADITPGMRSKLLVHQGTNSCLV